MHYTGIDIANTHGERQEKINKMALFENDDGNFT